MRFLTSPPSLVSLASSRIFCVPPFLPEILKVVGSGEFDFSHHVLNQLRACTLITWGFLSADVTRFWRPRLGFLTRIVLKVPMRGVRYDRFVFSKEEARKKFSQRSSFTPANSYPISLVVCYRKIHSDWIACTTAD